MVSFEKFTDYLSLASELKNIELTPSAQFLIEQLQSLCFQKFPLLVTVDLCGTLVLRAKRNDFPFAGDFSVKQKKYFLRPGHKELLTRLALHPRIKLAIYSSIMKHNLQPALDYVFAGLSFLSKEIKVFDQKFGRRMQDHPKYRKLQRKIDEHYRDLRLVWNDDFCKTY